MTERICIVGLDEPEYEQIREQVSVPVVAHETLPKIVVQNGQLLVERSSGPGMVTVSKLVFHAIFEDDLDFFVGLSLWGGPCFPNPYAMMNCRLKLPCLVHALRHSRFSGPPRGYMSPGSTVISEQKGVVKWGNWHCGENKAHFTGKWTSEHSSILEPFIDGEAVRVVVIGNFCCQIKLEGQDWLKSVHDPKADFMPIDDDLLDDTQNIRKALQLEIIAVDYIVAKEGTKHLLEVNHIPNVTRFHEIWDVYLEYIVKWIELV